MCGIFCYVCKSEDKTHAFEKFKLCKGYLSNRGPDSFRYIQVQLNTDWFAIFACSVLWTQGIVLSEQPFVNGRDVFLWNGDIYGRKDSQKESSDGEVLFSMIREGGTDILQTVSGPYAFIFWNSQEERLYFGRDPIGRHSLLWSSSATEINVSSVGNRNLDHLEELPCCGIFSVDFSQGDLSVRLQPWHYIVNPASYIPSINIPLILDHPINQPVYEERTVYHWLGTEPSEDDVILFKEKVLSGNVMEYLYGIPYLTDLVGKLTVLLKNSVKYRVQTKPEYCRQCLIEQNSCPHSKICILFSGGLDSSILACIADKFVPKDEPIDLLNVAFAHGSCSDFDVPDRRTGLESLKELQELSPGRKWNFLKIDVSQNELDEIRKSKIQDLIHPLKTILDDSLGCALWFAARGNGLLDGRPYSSPARVVLLGMGADELFGGYSRHRRIFNKEGWIGLGEELFREIRDISKRNLGRDNRVIADHGKQPRTPFLDEAIITFTNNLPPWKRCWLNFPQGVGDKLLLRLLAWSLGLEKVASFPKKALQFGSRIANPKEKGHHTSARLS